MGKYSFYCSKCKKDVTDITTEQLAGISINQFTHRCRKCNSLVMELSGAERLENLPKIEGIKLDAKKAKQIKKDSADNYLIASIACGLCGLVLFFPIDIFLSMCAIVCGRQAVVYGDSRGRIGIILGFIGFLPLLL